MGVGKRTMKTRERREEVNQKMADTEATKPTMTPVSLDEIPKRVVQGKAAPFVDEFLASGAEAVRVDNAAKGFKTTLSRYIKQNDVPAKVRTVNGTTYLTRA